MGSITLIAAIGRNNELGKDNGLIWSISEDLKFFKENTIGKPVVMGLNTFNSLPKLLPNRKHIVLTHKEVTLDSEVILYHNFDELLNYIKTLDEEVMIIGGGMMYSQMIEYADRMLLTEIDDESLADVYFPKFSYEDWDRNILSTHEYNNIKYSHVEYIRKKDA